MKNFSQYSHAVRIKAIEALILKGQHIKNIDVEGTDCLAECETAELGIPRPVKVEAPLYRWTPEMVAAYNNSVDGGGGRSHG